MKVRVHYSETWNRQQVVDVDEAEVREWASIPSDVAVTGKDVEKFFEATQWDRVTDTGQPPWIEEDTASKPGDRATDEFEGTDMGEVEVIPEVLAFATAASFVRHRDITWHLPAEGDTSTTSVHTACGIEIVIPDGPKMKPETDIHEICLSAARITRAQVKAAKAAMG